MTQITSWNVNSINSRLPHLLEYLQKQQPNIVLLQETKCINEKFPTEAIEDCGYNIALHGQKTYNGVAILSKHPIEDVSTTLPGNEDDPQARYIEAVIATDNTVLRIINVYVPNGQAPESEKFAYKMHFYKVLHLHLAHLLTQNEPIIIGGDYNVAPYPIDVYAPKQLDGKICFHPSERKILRELFQLGYHDSFRLIYPDSQQFSWWDYRGGSWQHNKGMRIDHILLSPEAANHLIDAGIDTGERGKEKASDHAPVWCRLA